MTHARGVAFVGSSRRAFLHRSSVAQVARGRGGVCHRHVLVVLMVGAEALSLMAHALVALGSNVRPGENLAAAIDALRSVDGVHDVRCSRYHTFPPIGGPRGQSNFVNMAAQVETSLSADELLERLFEIEASLGRRREVRWGPRTIDLDLLLYDSLVCDTPRLVLPHPRMAFRRFVLGPALEVAGEMVHPSTGWTVRRLYEHLRHAPHYVAVTGVPGTHKTSLALDAADAANGRCLFDAEAPAGGEPPAPIAAHDREEPLDYPSLIVGNELEFLAARRKAIASRVPGSELVVSDFWLDQSLAYAEVLGGAQAHDAFAAKLEETETPRPKLVVLVEAADLVVGPCNDVDRSPQAARWTVEKLAALADALVRATRRRDVGPVLRIAAEPRETASSEIVAAIEAMR